jgi:tetratricopeptide (TPR) repeat protein
MNPRSSLHLKALAVLFAAVCFALAGGDLIAQEQADPLQLRHGYQLALYKADGTRMTWAEMQNYNGRLRWEILSDKVTDRGRELLSKGRRAGASGDFEGALGLFEAAHEAAPGWEYPVYEAAYAHLLMGDWEQARKDYNLVNKLAPYGFFNSQQAAACLKLEVDGEVAPGTYRHLLQLDQVSASTARLTARGIVLDHPEYAAGWERVAFFTQDSKKALEAVDKGLASDPDPFTRDMLNFRRAVIANNDGDTAGAVKMLERQLRDPELTVAVEAQIKLLLPGLKGQLK